MKKRIWVLLLGFWLLAGTGLRAQSVYFCEGFNPETGEPVGNFTRWRIDSAGSFITLLFVNGKLPIGVGSLTFRISERVLDNWIPMDERTVLPEGKTYAALDYKFYKKGYFLVEVLLPNGGSLANNYAYIEYDETDASGVGSLYYKDFRLLAGERIEGDTIYGLADTFALQPEGMVLKFVLSGPKALRTPEVVIKVGLADSLGVFQNEAERIWTLQPNWKFVHFEERFTKPGAYRISAFTPGGVWVASKAIWLRP
jgi:hypothetical protein